MEASTLPGRYFADLDVYREETRRIFNKLWICVGRASDIPAAGDFILRELNGNSLIVVRDENGDVRCFDNVCRHRGTRLLENADGKLPGGIQCPYHAWRYQLNGVLKSAPNMSSEEGFKPTDFSLSSLQCRTWEGFICVQRDPGGSGVAENEPAFWSRFRDWQLAELVPAHRITYDVNANWKILFHNFSECYHCSLVHPQLNPVTSAASASNDFTEGPLLGGPMILNDGFATVSTGGELCGDVFPGLSAEDRQRVYFYTLFPTMFISPHPDYMLTHRVERRSVDRTRIICEWLFPPEICSRSEFSPEAAVEFWDMTNRQDWHVCELTQQGVQSDAYQPGPYSKQESMLAAFDRHYLSLMNEQ